jgi:hypothetical protein
MVHDKVVNFLRLHNLRNFGKKHIPERLLNRVDQSYFGVSDDEVGVVGGSMWEAD